MEETFWNCVVLFSFVSIHFMWHLSVRNSPAAGKEPQQAVIFIKDSWNYKIEMVILYVVKEASGSTSSACEGAFSAD